MKYFLITCARGHCGPRKSVDLTFAVYAETLVEAVSFAKKMPAIKHSRLPLYGKEIDYETYIFYREISAYKRFG